MLHHQFPDVAPALACLRMTTPNLPDLNYPADAEAHFEEVRTALQPWWRWQPTRDWFYSESNFTYLEDAWHMHYEGELRKLNATGKLLHNTIQTLFGPYIPLFIDWCSSKTLPPLLVATMKRVLRPTVAYITVSTTDDGPTGTTQLTTYPLPGYHWLLQERAYKQALRLAEIPNLLVLSAGGYGHAPLPQIKRPMEPAQELPVESRRFLASFTGSWANGPPNMRKRTGLILNELDTLLGLDKKFVSCYSYYCNQTFGFDWKHVMEDSRVILAPRGEGRNSFRLTEAVQLGRLPLQIYSDVPFVPYADLYYRIGWSLTNDELPHFLEQLAAGVGSFAPAALAQREKLAHAVRNSHFSMPGILEQIGRFMTDPNRSDVRCMRLPPTPRAKHANELQWVKPWSKPCPKSSVLIPEEQLCGQVTSPAEASRTQGRGAKTAGAEVAMKGTRALRLAERTPPANSSSTFTTAQWGCLQPNPCLNSSTGHSHSQFGEDVWLVENLFCDQCPGRRRNYVEMGALDGIKYSNTLMLERDFHWGGMLIEGQPGSAGQLFKNRLGGGRNAIFNEAICAETGTVTFAGGTASAISGVLETMSSEQKQVAQKIGHSKGGLRETNTVPCRPLRAMLQLVGLREIDAFILDVEGAELQVLRTMDWTVPVRVWLIEQAPHNPDVAKIDALMSEHGCVVKSWDALSLRPPPGMMPPDQRGTCERLSGPVWPGTSRSPVSACTGRARYRNG